MAKFSVDTHLFRELGELLVGRDSTALVELIKNAYDADAEKAIIYGEALGDPERGFIRIIDNGIGMDRQAFENGFLRIASRTKDSGSRLSRRYKRRYTGAKGIGRLAAHKLARLVEIESVPWREARTESVEAIFAAIDWDEIEKKETLADVETVLNSEPIGTEQTEGTTITLRRLRRPWTETERGRFLAEVQTFEPPRVLTAPLSKAVLEKHLLFESSRVRDSSAMDPGFRVVLEGEFAAGDEYWATMAEAAEWVIEIKASPGSDVEFAVAPTRKMVRSDPGASPYRYRKAHPEPEKGPFFEARILVREGQFKMSAGVKAWAKRAAGIRLFMEGFRVLPYGEPGNDWLSIDADYTRRMRSLPWLEAKGAEPDEGLSILPNSQYFGAVFLTEQGARSLRMLVNREGFVPEAGFDHLVGLLRIGIDLSVRVRAASKARRGASELALPNTSDPDRTSTESKRQNTTDLTNSLERATSALSQARLAAAQGKAEESFQHLNSAESAIANASNMARQVISGGAMLRVLASVGTQMAAFVHELNGLVGMVQSIDRVLGRLRDGIPAAELPRGTKSELAKLHGTVGDLKRALERQASYLIDVITPDARRRRMRQSLTERFEAGQRLINQIAAKRAITIFNDIPVSLKSPPMFPAEITTVFSNLLTNAVKAAGEKGKIRAYAEQLQDGKVRMVIENTGVAVDPKEGERWFKPFESTTVEIDAVLGQGMGLGLPITRNMLEEYGAEIRFTKPSRGFATAVEVVFPK